MPSCESRTDRRAVGVVNGQTDVLSVEEISGVGVQVFTFEGYSGFASSDVITQVPSWSVDLDDCSAHLQWGLSPSREINRRD